MIRLQIAVIDLIEEDRPIRVTQLKRALITHLRREAYFSVPAFLKISANYSVV